MSEYAYFCGCGCYDCPDCYHGDHPGFCLCCDADLDGDPGWGGLCIICLVRLAVDGREVPRIDERILR